MILATCSTIAAILMASSGGEQIRLTGICRPVTVSKTYRVRVTVEAAGATIQGLRITGGNLTWRGGTIRALGGPQAVSIDGYGVLLRGATNVTIDKVTFTAAKKAIVLDKARGIVISNSLFDEVGEDGIIASASTGVQIVGNRFQNTAPLPTICTTLAATITGLSSRACVAQGGVWKDGSHPDAVQLRNGMTDVLVARNIVSGKTQGLSQMDTTGDEPLRNVVIEHNQVAVGMSHAITLYPNCINCSIRWNTVKRGAGSSFKAVIRSGVALACGNVVQDVQLGTRPCS